jgi:hypothetical protein
VGLLYEMVIKKRRSAFLMQKQENGKQRIKDAASQRLSLTVQLPEHGIKPIKQQSQHTAGS